MKRVQIDGQVYDLLANVRKKPDGEYVYSIQLNENIGLPPAKIAQGDPASEWGTTDTTIVDQGEEDVKSKFSSETDASYSIKGSERVGD